MRSHGNTDVLVIEDLCKSFGGVHAVRSVSLSIKRVKKSL